MSQQNAIFEAQQERSKLEEEISRLLNDYELNHGVFVSGVTMDVVERTALGQFGKSQRTRHLRINVAVEI